MKKNRLIILFLGLVLLFAGCIPSQYTKGVEADEYPDKDLPIYDDAVIFDYEEDDEEVTIKYGTEDDVDDVIDFYQDYFEDEGIILDNEEAEDDEYVAEGFFEDFLFEIEVEEAKGDVEEKVFSSVAEVKIEFLDDDEIQERQGGNVQSDIIGFWEAVSMTYEDQEEDVTGIGMAMEFFADGTMDTYIFYVSDEMDSSQWSIPEEGILMYIDPTTGEEVKAGFIFEKQGKDMFLHITEDEVGYTLKKVDKDDFLEQGLDIGFDDIIDDDDDDIEVPVPGVGEQVLFDKEGIKITMMGFEENYYSLDLKLLIENTTDKQVDVDLQSIVVNGFSLQDAYVTGSVEGNVKLNTEISFGLDELERCKIDEIVDIEVIFEVVDYESWDTIVVSDVINITTDSRFNQTYDDSGVTLVNENGIKIVYQQFVPHDDYTGPYVVLYVENNGNQAAVIRSDNEQINGYMVSGYLYGTVHPGTRSILTLDFYISDLEDNNIDTIDSVKAVFQASYYDEWTYFIETELMDIPIN